MATLLATALRQRVRFPAGVDTIEVGPAARPTRLAPTDVEGNLRRFRQTAATYNAGRSGFRNWLSGQVTDASDPNADRCGSRAHLALA